MLVTLALFFGCSAPWVSAYLAEEDVGYDLLMKSAKEEFTDSCLKGTRPLPAVLEGDFIIGSAGLMEMGDRSLTSFLDAFGKYNKFTIKASGEVCATYRILHSKFYNESVKEGTVAAGGLFGTTVPPRHCPFYNPLCNLVPGDNTFVNTFMLAGELLSITDTPSMLVLDPVSLNVTGTKMWDDRGIQGMLGVLSSAHPVVRPGTQQTIDFVGNMNAITGAAEVVMYAIEEEKPTTRQKLASAPYDSTPYMHSFGITKDYMVLPRMPVKFGLPALGKPMVNAFSEIDLGDVPGPDNGFHVVPLNGDKPFVRPLPVKERLYYTHTINTYENQSGLLIDLTSGASNFFSSDQLTIANEMNKTRRDMCYPGCLSYIKRFLVPMQEDTLVTSEVVSDPGTWTEFTKFNPNYSGKKHCFVWAMERWSDYKSKAQMGIVKYNVCDRGDPAKTKLLWRRRNWYPSEAIMVPSQEVGAAEDDGFLIFVVLDGSAGKSWLIICDAKTMVTYSESGPFPRVAFTTHGEFYAKVVDAQATGSRTATVESERAAVLV